MNQSFNLLQVPWVPCIQADGSVVELGLRDTLVQAHELCELHGESPLVTAALYRLLLAVLHRVFGPASRADWGALWEAGRWDAESLDAYFVRWQQRFDLFHLERPFYQAADARVKPKAITSLVFEVASGNNPTLFDHHTDEEGITLTPASAARMLVAAQAFGLAGLSGLPQKFTDAPCARGMVFVVQANTLFETLALNLVRYPDLDEATMPDCPEDCPCWEMDDPFSPDRSLPYGYLDYLTWQNRRVLLIPDQADGRIVVRRMTAAPALRLDERTLNPMIHYRLDERRGPVPLVFTEERALWRDSAVLFCPSDTGYQLPRGFRWVAELVDEGFLEKSQTRRFLALGMSKKQAKVNFSRCEWMPLPLRCLQETDLMDALQTALQMAEATAKKLWGAARTLATLLLDAQADSASGRRPDRKDLDSLTQGWGIERRYWSRLEVPFRAILETLPDWREQVLENWRLKLIQAVWETFDPVTDSLGSDSRTLKALVRARSQLAAGLAETLPRASDAQRIES